MEVRAAGRPATSHASKAGALDEHEPGVEPEAAHASRHDRAHEEYRTGACPCGEPALPLPSGAYECTVCGRTFTLEPKKAEPPKP